MISDWRFFLGPLRLDLPVANNTNNQARTLRKILNVISQDTVLNKSKSIDNEIKNTLRKIDKISEQLNLKTLRDEVFAHLDKSYVFSTIRVFYSFNNIEQIEKNIKDVYHMLDNIYSICFGKHSVIREPDFDIPDIRNIKDFQIKASSYISRFGDFNSKITLDEKGLHFN